MGRPTAEIFAPKELDYNFRSTLYLLPDHVLRDGDRLPAVLLHLGLERLDRRVELSLAPLVARVELGQLGLELRLVRGEGVHLAVQDLKWRSERLSMRPIFTAPTRESV